MSMDSVSQRVATVPAPKSAEASGKRLNLKSGSKTLREMDESKIRKNSAALWGRYKDIEESEIRKLYDDSEKPFFYHCDRFKYRNKAQLRLDEEIKKAMDEYRRQSALLPPGPYDAIAPPAIAGLCGSIIPLTITDDDRPRLIRFCNLALDKYNAENENHGEIFVFDDLVKSTYRSVAGTAYYITFRAKSGEDAIKTFQAQVWHRMPGEGPPVVKSCSLKPS